uniref:Nitrate/nitrite transporter n=1 Tax=Eucampia antarctica TaxID=49252 RepID=A0A7S2SIF9_9STRA|mmetsp:Transcript_8754/g.8320  ORF Transcript_8754/g.8320 Transcript_8754/m.8320 type:complete len:482 (+) Transcript_8754:78-1523(+)
MSEIDTGKPLEPKKYQTYALKVDPEQDDRATEIKLFNISRPHMRAFHCSWWCFFNAFFIWFAIAPLLSEVKDTLKIEKSDIWTSSICSVAGTIFMRFINGPICDKYGARIPMAGIIMFASIPCALIGLANSTLTLCILRFLIGLGGSTFVMCQFWTTRMFTKEIAGTANAMVGGWGNLGGGVTQLVMGSVLFPLFKTGMSAETAWRTVSIVPAIAGFCTGVLILFISDDCPKGNYKDLIKNGIMPQVSAGASFRQGAVNFNTWILFIQYGCSFGVELTMNNAAALYFKDQFGQSTESAAAIASIFGWMNLFARGIGGYMSDKGNSRFGMRGRLWWQTTCILIEGCLVFVFANTTNLLAAIICMVFFSIFVQAAEGSTYGIVPYVNPPATGSIAGIVGAGGNVGAVCFGLCFRQMKTKDAFLVMGATILVSGFLGVIVMIKGHASMFWGEDSETVKAAWQGIGETVLSVPEPEPEKDDNDDA